MSGKKFIVNNYNNITWRARTEHNRAVTDVTRIQFSISDKRNTRRCASRALIARGRSRPGACSKQTK